MSGASLGRRERRLKHWRALLLHAHHHIKALEEAIPRPGIPEAVRMDQELKRAALIAAYRNKAAELQRRINLVTDNAHG